jgi:UDP-N-acetylglucosamine transferase subunit ALG13
MIFVTTGTQLPFPRMIDAVGRIAADLNEEIIAQVGPDTTPRDFPTHATLAPAQFTEFFGGARVVVAHAGIGSILSAKKFGKPVILMPRKHALGEHRNDHQMATAREVEGITGVYVAWNEDQLRATLARDDLVACDNTPSPRAQMLIDHLKSAIGG